MSEQKEKNLLKFFHLEAERKEVCTYVEINGDMSEDEFMLLERILADGHDVDGLHAMTHFEDKNPDYIHEFGPRMNFETPDSSNIVEICHLCGLVQVIRAEKSKRFFVESDNFVPSDFDEMTECRYLNPLTSFDTGIKPIEVFEIDLISGGPDVLLDYFGKAMDKRDRQFYYDHFALKNNRNPTIVEMTDLYNANSDHSRHGYFCGKQVINGEEMPRTLMEIVRSPIEELGKGNSIIAFHDNASAIEGFKFVGYLPETPGLPTSLVPHDLTYALIFTAESHNFPTGISSFAGAATGGGGMLRDKKGVGRGGFVCVSTTGYSVASLSINGYDLPWEKGLGQFPPNMKSPLHIVIEASNGASRYGNEFGMPVVSGFAESIDIRTPLGERWASVKPTMFIGGLGQMDSCLAEKGVPKKGMLIVQIGGPAYRVGFGGGAASSMLQGENDEKLDFNAVQRGNPEMGRKVYSVIKTCNEMGANSPILTIHDQGAGGPANVLKELVEKEGGRVDIREIVVGDKTMSVLEIWVAEFQERMGMVIPLDRIDEFKSICERERVNCEVLGEVTGDGQFTVVDSWNDTKPVQFDLYDVLGNVPQKCFVDETVDLGLEPVVLPKDLTIADALERVLLLMQVGSKRFLVNKVDRSVTGLVAQQQCCGPLQLPVGDVAVMAQSHFSTTGAATSIGQNSLAFIVSPEKASRLVLAESLTNLLSVRITDRKDIKFSGNWMWAPKLKGEGAAIYKAALSLEDALIEAGVSIDGGKDSLSMATIVGDETVKSPRQLVMSSYVGVPDITKVVTPDIKKPGESTLLFFDLSDGSNNLGTSALAYVYSQLGDDCPDVDFVNYNIALEILNQMHDNGLILSIHDRSSDGLIIALSEMAFAGNCGFEIDLDEYNYDTPCECRDDVLSELFSGGPGVVVEVDNKHLSQLFTDFHVYDLVIGKTVENKVLKVIHLDDIVFEGDMEYYRDLWERTSFQLEKQQTNHDCVEQEMKSVYSRIGLTYNVNFVPKPTPKSIMEMDGKPKVLVLREEGSNGDSEMNSFFIMAGFNVVNAHMSDLLSGKVDLADFRIVVFVGGFSFGDALGAGKGWATIILERLREMFEKFRNRLDTLSLGDCNGCQLMVLLGWVSPTGNIRDIRFVKNNSGRFESRWSVVKILSSKAIMLQGMEDSVLGIHVAHGEGKLQLRNDELLDDLCINGQIAMAYVDDDHKITEEYPFNPNGSSDGITAICSPDGRHLAMMPHPERAFLKWQWHYMPQEMKDDLEASPWLRMTQNAYQWCIDNPS